MELARAILFVKDLPRMAAFYRDTLGLPVVDEQEGWVELAAGAASLGLHAIPDEIAAGITIETPASVREETPIKLAFAVADVAGQRARLVEAGVVMRDPRPWGCDGIDPEGNVFQLIAR
jgi:catechol 2,3-dioxygenase-like lactoylglutathione lyase family enzyme